MAVAWMPMVFLCVWGMYLPMNVRITIGLIAMLFPLVTSILFLGTIQSDVFWKSKENIDKLKKELESEIIAYRNAKEKLIKKYLE